METFIESAEYARFIMPTADELKEEKRLLSLSETEKQLENLRNAYLDGKISKDRYEDGIGCELFHALDAGKITQEEDNALYEKFKLAN